MLKTRLAVGLMLLALLVGFQGARPARAGDQDFQLINRTGADIHAIYVSPVDTESWEQDLLGGAVLQNGGDVVVRFAPDTDAELWDLRVEDVDGDARMYHSVNLMEVSQVILESDGNARVK